MSYIVGEHLQVSGVLTTVTCGLVMGSKQHTVLSAVTRTQAGAVWEVVGFILESLIFVLIGLSLRGVLSRLGGSWQAIENRCRRRSRPLRPSSLPASSGSFPGLIYRGYSYRPCDAPIPIRLSPYPW